MVRALRWPTLAVATALLVHLANAGSASALPDLGAAEQLCAAQSQGVGRFLVGTGARYGCHLDVSASPFLDEELEAARQLCESAYRGQFGLTPDHRVYACNGYALS